MALREWLISDCMRCNSCAVGVKLSERANARKTRSCLRSNGSIVYEFHSAVPFELKKKAFIVLISRIGTGAAI